MDANINNLKQITKFRARFSSNFVNSETLFYDFETSDSVFPLLSKKNDWRNE